MKKLFAFFILVMPLSCYSADQYIKILCPSMEGIIYYGKGKYEVSKILEPIVIERFDKDRATVTSYDITTPLNVVGFTKNFITFQERAGSSIAIYSFNYTTNELMYSRHTSNDNGFYSVNLGAKCEVLK